MCYVCCKELKGWCKSFTRTEGLLSILEGILLGVLISFLVFLVLHFLACRACPEPAPKKDSEKQLPTSVSPNISPTQHSTLSPGVECTWEPSQPTTARTRYYLSDRRSSPGDTSSITTRYSKSPSTTTEPLEIFDETVEPSHEYDDVEFLEHSDGEPAEDRYKNQVVALVKLKPPGDVTFGCILTKITKFWTLTAASCIESIEEVDSLDSFVIMEGFGSEGASRPRTVVDVRLHPLYAAAARAHDLAALRADRALRARAPPLRLPRLLDYFLVALGERFHILGYGGYRTIDKSAESRQLRQVSVFVVSSAACAAAGRAERWAPRHLLRGAAAGRAERWAPRHLLRGAAAGRAERWAPRHLLRGAAAGRAERWAPRHLLRGAAAGRAERWAPRHLLRGAAAGRAERWAPRHLLRGAAAGRAERWAPRHLLRGAAAGRAERWAPRHLLRGAAAGRAERWAPRHLLRGAAARHGACCAAPLCAGARFSRGTPCNYCAGTPLLREHTLFGVMSDNSACGVACEPQLYVNIATLRDWIDSVIE